MTTPDSCHISTVIADDEAVVVVAGEVDLQVRDELSSVLMKVQAPNHALVVDLSGVTFMDSSGLHALLNAYKAHRDLGQAFTIRAPSVAIVQLFKLSGVDKVLPIQSGP
jgi:anti-sigma B factor antagonist